MVRYSSDSRDTTVHSERRKDKGRKRGEESASPRRKTKKSSSRSRSTSKKSSKRSSSVPTRDERRQPEVVVRKKKDRSKPKKEVNSRKKERGRSRTRRASSRDQRDDDIVYSRAAPVATDNRRAFSFDDSTLVTADYWEVKPLGGDLGLCGPELICCGCIPADDDFSVYDLSTQRPSTRALTITSTFNTELSDDYSSPNMYADQEPIHHKPRRWFKNLMQADDASVASDDSIGLNTQVSVVMNDTLFLWNDPTPVRPRKSKKTRREDNGSSAMWNPPRCASSALVVEGQGLTRSIEAANGTGDGITSFKGPSKAACRDVLEQLQKKRKTESPYKSIPFPTVPRTIIFPPFVDEHLLGKRDRSSSEEDPVHPVSFSPFALPAHYGNAVKRFSVIEPQKKTHTPWTIKNLESKPILTTTSTAPVSTPAVPPPNKTIILPAPSSTSVAPPANETILLSAGEHQAKGIPMTNETGIASEEKAASVLEKLAQAGIIMDREKAPKPSKTDGKKKLSKSAKSFLDGRAEHNHSTGPLADPTLAQLDKELDFLRSMLSTPSNVERSQPDPTSKKNDDIDEIENARSVELKEEEPAALSSSSNSSKDDAAMNDSYDSSSGSEAVEEEPTAVESKEEEPTASIASTSNLVVPSADTGISTKSKPSPEQPCVSSTVSLVAEAALKTISGDIGSLIDGKSVQTESPSTAMRKEKLATLLSKLSFDARADTSANTKSAHVPRASQKTTGSNKRTEAVLPPKAGKKQKSRPPDVPDLISRDNNVHDKNTEAQQNASTTTVSAEQNANTAPSDASSRSDDASRKAPSDDSRPEVIAQATSTPSQPAAPATVSGGQQDTTATEEQKSEERPSASELKLSSPTTQSPVSLDSPQPISEEQASGDIGNEKPSGPTSPTSVTAILNQKETKSAETALSTPTSSVAVVDVVTKPRTRAVQSPKDIAMSRLVEDVLKALVRGAKPDFDAARALIEKSKASKPGTDTPEKDESESSASDDKAAKADPINVLLKDIELYTDYEQAQSGKLSSTGKFLTRGSTAIQRIISEENGKTSPAKSRNAAGRRPAPSPEGGMGRMGMSPRRMRS